jgi:hypothetical protein
MTAKARTNLELATVTVGPLGGVKSKRKSANTWLCPVATNPNKMTVVIERVELLEECQRLQPKARRYKEQRNEYHEEVCRLTTKLDRYKEQRNKYHDEASRLKTTQDEA